MAKYLVSVTVTTNHLVEVEVDDAHRGIVGESMASHIARGYRPDAIRREWPPVGTTSFVREATRAE